MLGVEYISQHVRQRHKSDQETAAWKMYIAESLRHISENTAKSSGGSYMATKWKDIIAPEKEETRTAEEIIAHMKNRLKEVE